MRFQVPEALKHYLEIGDGPQPSIQDKVMEHWVMKYSSQFRTFVDTFEPENEEDKAFIVRVLEGQITPEDFERLKTILEDLCGPLFTEEEMAEFIRLYVH